MADVDPATLKRQTDCAHNKDRPDWMLARTKTDMPVCPFCGESKTAMERRKTVTTPFGTFRMP